MKHKILFVCLGNICRSPAAEVVFNNLLKARGISDNFEVDSAGTGSWHVGSLADKRMRQAANSRGVVIDSVARQITMEDFHKFDYILAMDAENLKGIKSLAKVSDEKLNSTIALMLDFAKSTDFSEVPDPYYGGEKGFELVLDLLEDACNGLLEKIISQG